MIVNKIVGGKLPDAGGVGWGVASSEAVGVELALKVGVAEAKEVGVAEDKALTVGVAVILGV